MDKKVIYSSPFIEIVKREDGYYIQSFKKGLSFDELNKIISSYPEIKISNFLAIKEALVFAPQEARLFAKANERISVQVSDDELKAYIYLSIGQDEIKNPEIIKEIVLKLNEEGVVYGIKREALLNLCIDKKILVAEGLLPQPGHDSRNNLYKLREIKPEIKEDGNADHYELNLINIVEKGDWLGERINATQGIEGMSVRGRVIKPMPGKNYPLLYDKKTVREVVEENKSTLYAMCNGAVFFQGDSIGVSNHLEIQGNIGVKTGNVDFDGYITVKGSVEDNFTVISTKDIEILGDYGVGNVREIVSREGSIYIKGGLAGKGRTTVRCKKNLYLKYVSNAEIICDGSVHIGFYCINSNITAKEVILESFKGQIMGGIISAEIKVVSAIIGSASEKRTNINVTGFDRNELKGKLDELSEKIDILKDEINQYKQKITIFLNSQNGFRDIQKEYNDINDKYKELKTYLQEIEENRKNIKNYLTAKGEGEITILKRGFPNTLLEIKKLQKELQQCVLKVSYYYSEGTIKEM